MIRIKKAFNLLKGEHAEIYPNKILTVRVENERGESKTGNILTRVTHVPAAGENEWIELVPARANCTSEVWKSAVKEFRIDTEIQDSLAGWYAARAGNYYENFADANLSGDEVVEKALDFLHPDNRLQKQFSIQR